MLENCGTTCWPYNTGCGCGGAPGWNGMPCRKLSTSCLNISISLDMSVCDCFICAMKSMAVNRERASATPGKR